MAHDYRRPSGQRPGYPPSQQSARQGQHQQPRRPPPDIDPDDDFDDTDEPASPPPKKDSGPKPAKITMGKFNLDTKTVAHLFLYGIVGFLILEYASGRWNPLDALRHVHIPGAGAGFARHYGGPRPYEEAGDASDYGVNPRTWRPRPGQHYKWRMCDRRGCGAWNDSEQHPEPRE